jgi:DNA-binding response OmpR family regulator
MTRILVIDDDVRIREVIADTLSAEGYAVTQAINGAEGTTKFRAEPFDLIITDLYMPEKEGLETIIELRREFPRLKILAVSGAHTEQLRIAKLLGADRTLSKPFDIADLIDAVNGLLA